MYRYDQPPPEPSTSQTSKCCSVKNNDKTNINFFLSNIDLPSKRSQHLEDEESALWSWHSADKKIKSKYIDAYTSTCYSKTDFGDEDDKYPQVRFGFTSISSPSFFFLLNHFSLLVDD